MELQLNTFYLTEYFYLKRKKQWTVTVARS